jgi:aryl-alcohol dehydrogenase-like predicted oxidoreductase
MSLLEASLKRLRTDYLDLWQIHHLSSKEEVDQVFGESGAMKALLKAREEGMVRRLGITGHEDPIVLMEAMKRHPFDAVLCPVNAADKHVKPSFVEKLVPNARRRRMGIVGMKVFSQGFMFRKGGVETAWEALSYALSQPVSTVIAGVDSVAQLEENVAIAKSFEPLGKKRQEEIESRTRSYPRRAAFFRGKYGGYSSRDELEEEPWFG